MIKPSVLFAVIAVSALRMMVVSPVFAQEMDRLHRIEKQLDEQKRKQENLDEEAQNAGKNLEDLRQRMIASTQALQEQEARKEKLESRLDELNREIVEKRKVVDRDREHLSLVASALVGISSRPPATLFLQSGSAQDQIHRSVLLRAIMPRLRGHADIAARDLSDLYDLQSKVDTQKRLVQAAGENLKLQQAELDKMILARKGFIQRTVQQRAEISERLAKLSDEASDLKQLMQKVSIPRVIKKEPRSNSALKWPVRGMVSKKFGDKDSAGVVSEGITLTATSGAPVVAPRSGKVAFAGMFKGYGLIVILQHDGGYHSLLSGFGRIDAEMGQEVGSGEPLGVLPVKPGSKPELYFEWRRDENPINPADSMDSKSS